MMRCAIVLGLSLCPCGLWAQSEWDSMLYHFPKPYPKTLTGEKIRMMDIAGQITEHTSALEAGRYLSEDQYRTYQTLLDQVHGSAADPSVKTDAQRREIILAWAANRCDGREAAHRMEALARTIRDTQDRAFTNAYAMVIHARLHDMSEMKRVFDALNPKDVPQFGWFAFETVKYYGKYVGAGATGAERESGQPIVEEYRRRLEFSEFLEKKYLPALTDYESVLEIFLPLERAQFLSVFDLTAENARRYLAARKYMDISQRATDVLFPQLMDLWKEALAHLLPTDGYIDPNIEQSRLNEYATSILPRIKMLQEQKQYIEAFGDESALAEKAVGEVLEMEVLGTPQARTDDNIVSESEQIVTDPCVAAEQPGDDGGNGGGVNAILLISVASLCLISVVGVAVYSRWKVRRSGGQ